MSHCQKIAQTVRRSFALLTLVLATPMVGSASSPLDLPVCDLLLKSGALVDADSMQTLLQKLDRYLEGMKQLLGGKKPLVFSNPETLAKLEASFGPIVSFTTFSKELDDDTKFHIANHAFGLLSSLPRGEVIPASGGTMGDFDNPEAEGGGVGIFQQAAIQMGFPVLSITASKGFGFKPAPAHFLFFTLGEFGSESELMLRHSKVLVVMGGGGQATREGLEYLIRNPNGFLIVIDDKRIGGASESILNDPRFRELAAVDSRIAIVRSGNEAGVRIAQRLGLRARLETVNETMAESRRNIHDASVNYGLLGVKSKVIVYSGWSDFSKAGPTLQGDTAQLVAKNVEKALAHVHEALISSKTTLVYSDAGNDPPAKNGIPAFETLIHRLPKAKGIYSAAISSRELNFDELNPDVAAVSFVAPTWASRTLELIARGDVFISSGGNQAVLDQAVHAKNRSLPHLHIVGANPLTDMSIQRLQNPKLHALTPDQILNLSYNEILSILQIEKRAPQKN